MNRKAVLGIDAAWTATQPSGIAVAVSTGGGWKLDACASSYQRLFSLADTDLIPESRSLGSRPDARRLLIAASQLSGGPIDLVAIDMPLSMQPITARRASDDAISRTYGGRKAGTHTPSAVRPGPISDVLRQQFSDAGYPLCTTSISTPGLIEVYPHPALIELAGASERLKYKLQRAAKYWPALNAQTRRQQILREWALIVRLLETEIQGVSAMLTLPSEFATVVELKAFEDMLDAAVCCWVAICALEGRAAAFGDDTSGIWVPVPRDP